MNFRDTIYKILLARQKKDKQHSSIDRPRATILVILKARSFQLEIHSPS